MYQSDYTPIVYRRELKKVLQLSSKQIKYLIDNGIIETKFIRKKEMVNIPSLRSFQSSFNINDFMTKSEVLSKLKDKGYYAEYIPFLKMYDTYFMGFPHTFKNFVDRGYLKTYQIAKTIYVTKKSFNHLYKLLDDTYNELYLSGDFDEIYNSVKNKQKNFKPTKIRFNLFGKKVAP